MKSFLFDSNKKRFIIQTEIDSIDNVQVKSLVIIDTFTNKEISNTKIERPLLEKIGILIMLCKQYNNDFDLYNKNIENFAGDMPLECRNCHTRNLHFSKGAWTCAFC
jgi:hypothetical protein